MNGSRKTSYCIPEIRGERWQSFIGEKYKGNKKAKMNKLDYIKLKTFCTAIGDTKKMKRLPTEWEKIFANDI